MKQSLNDSKIKRNGTRAAFLKAIRRLPAFILLACVIQVVYVYNVSNQLSYESQENLTHRASLVKKCQSIRAPAGPPASFQPSSRVQSRNGNERWVPGTPPVLLTNAKIWTGADNGTEKIDGSILLDRGLVIAVGDIPASLLAKHNVHGQLQRIDVEGKWVTPGLVDLHSHIGVSSAPGLRGSADSNSHKAPILPWLRSIDGMNTHDEAYQLAMAGGVTSAQILPGSANNIGGQAFVIKLRPTSERSSTSKVIEPPWALTHNDTDAAQSGYVRWRHMKHACGENPDRRYSQTRMDGQWNFRNAYDEARRIRDKQDAFCAKVDAGDWAALGNVNAEFPEDLQWESLVDVLRGRVKLAIHCYEAVDLDGIVRLSNEFQFPVASFHHAGETYLVPDLLKKTWGGAPSIALFASNFRKKREAYRGSEFAPRILAEHGIPVVMKSDHPVMNSRYLLFEAQQAYHYGLDPSLSLASVTSVPARAAGLGHRIGTLATGYDADLVIWDSHPLTIGATPEQVYVDGIAQFSEPIAVKKPSALQNLPKVPNWDKEKNATVKWDGLPPLQPAIKKSGAVKLLNVMSLRGGLGEIKAERPFWAMAIQGSLACIEWLGECPIGDDDVELVVDLEGGSIALPLITYGSPLGLVEIRLEPSTNDGSVLDPLTDGELHNVLKGKEGGIMRAVDGLMFEGVNTKTTYRSGVGFAVTAPQGSGFLQGLSTVFSMGASHALEGGAIAQEEAALHITISYSLSTSVSTQVSALREALFAVESENQFTSSGANIWQRVRDGQTTLVISVLNADIMSTLIHLKSEYEEITGNILRMTFSGATEAHLLAKEIAAADISIILTSPRPYPGTWEQRRILAGPPLTSDTTISQLLRAGVNVAIGIVDEAAARNTRFDLAWIIRESNGTISEDTAFNMVTQNFGKALGLNITGYSFPDLMLYSGGGVFDFESKVIGVLAYSRGVVEIF